MAGASGPTTVSTKQRRIATLAREAKDMAFTSLSLGIDIEWMKEAYRRTRKNGAAGIDGQTAEAYAVHLEENLRSLLDRAKSGDRYRAPPVKRAHIPKGDGSETRPIGIPTFEELRPTIDDRLIEERQIQRILEGLRERYHVEIRN